MRPIKLVPACPGAPHTLNRAPNEYHPYEWGGGVPMVCYKVENLLLHQVISVWPPSWRGFELIAKLMLCWYGRPSFHHTTVSIVSLTNSTSIRSQYKSICFDRLPSNAKCCLLKNTQKNVKRTFVFCSMNKKCSRTACTVYLYCDNVYLRFNHCISSEIQWAITSVLSIPSNTTRPEYNNSANSNMK